VTAPRPGSLAWLALAGLGCASLGRLPPSGPGWLELASEHFVVRTDVGEAQAGELVEQLELLRGAVLASLYLADADAPGRVEVIAFRRTEEFEAFAPRHASAFALRDAGGLPRIVMPGGLGSWQRVVLAHELTHSLAAALFAHQARWLTEGLAVTMEGLAEVPLGRRMLLVQTHQGRPLRTKHQRVPAGELFAWGESPVERPWTDAYASAWMLVRHLMERHPAAMRDLLGRLRRGETVERAFAAAFPQWDPARPGALQDLDAALARDWAGDLALAGREIEVRGGAAFTARPLPPAEVAALRIALWETGPPKGEGALRAEIAAALRHDPDHPLALERLAELDGGDPLPAARRSVSAHLGDPRAWTFLARSLRGADATPEREAAYRRAVELAPGNALALANLARDVAAAGRAAEAVGLSGRAAELAPWSAALARQHAAALAAAGRCAEAAAAQRRALGLLTERGAGDERREMRRRLEEIERGCRATEAGSGPAAPPAR
jgi:tetratricopeptide (TPR) repeat protein